MFTRWAGGFLLLLAVGLQANVTTAAQRDEKLTDIKKGLWIGVRGDPATLLIDANGKLLGKFHDQRSWKRC